MSYSGGENYERNPAPIAVSDQPPDTENGSVDGGVADQGAGGTESPLYTSRPPNRIGHIEAQATRKSPVGRQESRLPGD